MSKINDGGPAFPLAVTDASFCNENGGHNFRVDNVPGMSLRDWFAGMAMQAIVGTFRQTFRGKEDARTDADADLTTFYRDMALDWNFKTGEEDGASEIASDAYIIADAMLKAGGHI